MQKKSRKLIQKTSELTTIFQPDSIVSGLALSEDMPRLYNLNSHKALRRQLRREATTAERRLWCYLKNRKFHGFLFRRQHGIGRYIVDFYCPKLRLVIEIDGEVHQKLEIHLNDEIRQRYIEDCYLRVVRFTNDEVNNNIVEVMKKLGELVTSP